MGRFIAYIKNISFGIRTQINWILRPWAVLISLSLSHGIYIHTLEHTDSIEYCAALQTNDISHPNLAKVHDRLLSEKQPGPLDSLDISYIGEKSSIHGLWRCPGEGNDYPLQYSWLKKTMDRGSWWATVYGVSVRQD